MTFNSEQRKYLAGVIEKASLAYFGVFGYTWYTKGEWLLVAHVVIVFAATQLVAIWVLKDRKERSDE